MYINKLNFSSSYYLLTRIDILIILYLSRTSNFIFTKNPQNSNFGLHRHLLFCTRVQCRFVDKSEMTLIRTIEVM